MQKKTIVLLCGKSGSGKTTVANYLEEKYGWKSVVSYTDRAMRSPDEKGHIFVTPERFDMIPRKEMVAYTEFSGHRYCATRAQVESSDIYVIDPRGILEFKERYKGSKTPVIIYLSASDKLLSFRMQARGDSEDEVLKRIAHDRKAFRGAAKMADRRISVSGKTPEDIAKAIIAFIKA